MASITVVGRPLFTRMYGVLLCRADAEIAAPSLWCMKPVHASTIWYTPTRTLLESASI